MTKANIQSEWDSLGTITKDIALYLQECEMIGGDELKDKVVKAILNGIEKSKEDSYIEV
jgi:hypothetical protein